MTAITYDGATPTVGADADTWGSELNIGALAKIKVDLDMLNATPTARILGRVTASTGEVERLTGTQATTLLDAVVGDSGAGGTKGLVPAPAAGDAAARKMLKADGTWVRPFAADGTFAGASGATLGTAYNLACSRASIGVYNLTFTSALPDAFYRVLVTIGDNTSGTVRVSQGGGSPKTTAGFTLQILDVASALYDPDEIYVLVIT